MSEWATESEDLFRSARREIAATSAGSPTTADRDRIRARLAAKLGAGALAGAAALTTSNAAASVAAPAAATATAVKGGGSATLLLVAKITAPLLVIGAAAGIAAPRVIAQRAQHDRGPAPTTTSAPTAATPITLAPKATASPTASNDDGPTISVDALPSASAYEPARRTPAPAASISAEEAALVAQLDAALRANDMARAKELVSEHEHRFPHGSLVEEREGARVLVRCTLGQSKASARAADVFLAAHPKTPMRARILAACATQNDAPSNDPSAR